MENNCPICLLELTNGFTQVPCCVKRLHTKCLADCIYHKIPYRCPFCRSLENPLGDDYVLLNTSDQDIFRQVVVEVPTDRRREATIQNCKWCCKCCSSLILLYFGLVAISYFI